MIKKEVLYGILTGLMVAIAMRFIPVFHGPNSNIIKHMDFKEDDKCYTLTPYPIECPI